MGPPPARQTSGHVQMKSTDPEVHHVEHRAAIMFLYECQLKSKEKKQVEFIHLPLLSQCGNGLLSATSASHQPPIRGCYFALDSLILYHLVRIALRVTTQS